MYIESSYHTLLPKRALKTPRDRYKRYYQDLHARYQMTLDENTLLTGQQYQFNELCYPAMDYFKEMNLINKIDLLVIAHWSHEFDPDYSTLGPHLLHRYQMNSAIFDICDKGSLCSLVALFLLMQYQHNQASEKALLLTFDQTTIPRADDNSDIVPTQDAVAALLISKEKLTQQSIKIIDVEIWGENTGCHSFDLLPLLIKWLNKHAITINQCTLHIKKNTTVYRAMKFYFPHQQDINQRLQINFLPNHVGTTNLFEFIDQLHNRTRHMLRSYQIVLDEDVESLETALILLETPNDGISNDEYAN